MVGQLIHFEMKPKPLLFICAAANRLKLKQWECFCRDPSAMRWAGHVARMGNKRGAYKGLMGKPEEKRLLGRPRRRCR